jgi:hypothetical protein
MEWYDDKAGSASLPVYDIAARCTAFDADCLRVWSPVIPGTLAGLNPENPDRNNRPEHG